MSTDERKVQLGFAVDTTDAEQGIDRLERRVGAAAQAMDKAGATASKGFDGISKAAEAAAQKTEEKVGRMTAAVKKVSEAAAKTGDGVAAGMKKVGDADAYMSTVLQRRLAIEERLAAGPRGSAAYYDVMARQLGANAQALQANLTQLDAYRAKSAAMAAGTGLATVGLDKMGMSARATAQALRQVPLQFQDIIISLQAGQQPLSVLLQQGSQLTGSFGGMGAAAKALGGYMMSLVTPVTVLIGAVGGLGYSLHAGGEELRAFQNAATMSGNALAGSGDEFAKLRDGLLGIAGTKGRAAEVLTEVASNGKIAAENIKAVSEAAILMERATGQAVKATVQQFAELGNDPVKASEKLNASYNFLTTSIYQQIRALDEQGERARAAQLATETFANVTKDRAAIVIDNVGLMEDAWRTLVKVIKQAGDAALEVGRQQTMAQQLAAVQGDIRSATGQDRNRPFRLPWQDSLESLREQERRLIRQMELTQGNVEAAAELARVQAAGVAAVEAVSKANDRAAGKQVQMNKALKEYRDQIAAIRAADPNSILLDPKAIAAAEAGIRKQFKETGGGAGVGETELAGIAARIKERQEYLARLQAAPIGVDVVKPLPGEERLAKIQEELKTSISGTARAMKEKALALAQIEAAVDVAIDKEEKYRKAVAASEATLMKQVDAAGAQADRIREQALGQEAANAAFGKSKTAIEAMALAQMQANLAEADSSDRFSPAYVAALREKTEWQARYVAGLQEQEAKQLALANSEWGRLAGEEAKTLQLEVSLLGVSQQMRETIIAQRGVELDLAKRIAEIDKSSASEARKAELRADAEATALIAKTNAAQRGMLDEWRRTTDSINESLTDAILRGFESGKGFAQNLADTVKNMFATMVLRPIVQATMAPVSGAAAQLLNGGTGGGSSALGGLMNNSSMLTNAMGGGEGLFVGGMNGSGLLGGLGTAAFGSAGAYAGGVAGLSAAGAGSQAALLAAQTGTFGAAGLSATAAAGAGAAGAGAAAGGAAAGAGFAGTAAMAIPYVGWAIAIGSVLYSMFGQDGGGKKSEGAAGSLGLLDELGTRGSSDSQSRQSANAVRATVTDQYAQLAKAYGIKDRYSFGVGFSMDPVGDAPSFAEVTATQGGKVKYSTGSADLARGEEALQINLADFSAKTILKAMQASGLKEGIGEYLRELGDIDKLSRGATASAIARVQKAGAEKQALDAQILALTTTGLQQLTAARKAERKALDETNRSLYDQVARLTDLKGAAEAAAAAVTTSRDALLQAYNREEEKARDASQAADAARGVLSDAYARESEALKEAASRHRDYATSLRDVRNSLSAGDGSPLSRAAQTEAARKAFDSTAKSATKGNETALQNVGGLATEYVEAARASARSSVEVAIAIARAQAGLTTAAAAADGRATAAEKELAALNKQVKGMDVLNDSMVSVKDAIKAYLKAESREGVAQKQLDAATKSLKGLGVLNTSVQSMSSALSNYLKAIAASTAAMAKASKAGLPGYASGGLATGLAIVGERGPEIVDFQTPGRVYTSEDTRGMFSQNPELASVMRELLAEMKAQRADGRVIGAAMVGPLLKLESIERKREAIGMPPERATT